MEDPWENLAQQHRQQGLIIKLDYEIKEIAPYEYWDRFPPVDEGEYRLKLFEELIKNLRDSDIYPSLPPYFKETIDEFFSGSAPTIIETHDFTLSSGLSKPVSLKRGSKINNKFCHTLFWWLVNKGYRDGDDETLSRNLLEIERTLKDEFRYLITGVSINGRELPFLEERVCVSGDSYASLTRTFPDKSIDMIFFPAKDSIKRYFKLYKIAGVFPGPDYELPPETLDGLKWSMLENPDRNYLQQFVFMERYIAYLYDGLVRLASFIEWAEQEDATSHLATALRQEYNLYVTIEIDRNLGFSPFRSITDQISKLSSKQIPEFNPSRHDRAGTVLSIEEHLESIMNDHTKSPRSKKTLVEELKSLLYQPLRQISNEYT